MCETQIEAPIGSVEADALCYSKLLIQIYVQQRRKLIVTSVLNMMSPALCVALNIISYTLETKQMSVSMFLT